MIPPSRNNPRAEYRLREIERANLSPSLAEKFPRLKSLKADLAYFDSDGMTQTGALRYKVNVAHAKSVFSFVCQSGECLAGGFDLSNAVAEAVTGRRKSAAGEIRCQGTVEKPNQSKRPCRNVIRYKLTLGYALASPLRKTKRAKTAEAKSRTILGHAQGALCRRVSRAGNVSHTGKLTKHAMSPETEMDNFFARNCFTEAERKRVKAWTPYRVAMDKIDIIEAQEIAMCVLERGLGLSRDSSAPRLS